MHTRFSFLVFLLSLPFLSDACKCVPPTVPSALSAAEAVFRGQILRVLPSVDEAPLKSYVVLVKRIFKGCDFSASERIVVSTSSSSASCGVPLETNKTYVLSGETDAVSAALKKKLGKNTKITQNVLVNACSFNRLLEDVTSEELKELRAYSNECSKPCETGADCNAASEYCDAGTCVAFNAPCPTPPVKCFADPCTVAEPCTESQKCYSNDCGGCNAIFVDAKGTRVCNTK